MTERDNLTIAARFNGPAGSGNGGYSCGLLAKFVDSDTVQVRLQKPPPLETMLDVSVSEGGQTIASLGEVTIATATPTDLDIATPDPIDFSVARQAHSSGEAFNRSHTYPTCFVCGVDRNAGDGLRLFAGSTQQPGIWAAVWTPSAEYADESGAVSEEIVWSALDCPTYPAAANDVSPPPEALLGQLTARLEHKLQPEKDYLVMSWHLGADGRKRKAASAIFDQSGQRCAVAQALWITLRTDHLHHGGRGS